MSVPGLLIPEFVLYETLKIGLNFIRSDYNNQVDKTKSFLYKLTQGIGLQKYNYFEQASHVFVINETDPRCINLDLGFNMQKDRPVSIHITMPAESPGQNALANDEGYHEQVYDSEDSIEYSTVYTRRYKATYDIVIVSDNSNEVVMIYHILRALIVSLTTHLHLNGLQNLAYSGQDLQPYAELVPKTIFMRAIRLGIEYESSSYSLAKKLSPTDIIFEGHVISPFPKEL